METNGARAVTVLMLVGILRLLWGATRFVLFILLCVFGRLIEPLLAFMSGCGLLVFLFFWLLVPGHAGPEWGGLGLAVGAAALLFLYQAAKQALAPAGMVIISDL